jgi:ABC-type branched-subunit amino acid transport system ATPase component
MKQAEIESLRVAPIRKLADTVWQSGGMMVLLVEQFVALAPGIGGHAHGLRCGQIVYDGVRLWRARRISCTLSIAAITPPDGFERLT